MTIKFLLPISTLAVSCFFAGCSHLPWTHLGAKSPALVSTSKAGQKLVFSGDAMSPGKVTESRVVTSLPLPSGSTLTEDIRTDDKKNSPSTSRFVLSGESVMTRSEETTITEGPKAFLPPAPPSQSELAKGAGIRMFYWIGGAFIIAGLLFAYLQHYKAAGFAALGAFLAPLLGGFLASEHAFLILSVFAAISLTLVAAWYSMNHTEKVKEILAHLPAEKLNQLRSQLEVAPASQ